MYCKNCGKQIPDAAKFCDGCGSPVVEQPTYAPPTPQPQFQPNPTKPKKKKNRLVLIIIAAVIVIGSVSCIASIGGKSDSDSDGQSTQSSMGESTVSEVSEETSTAPGSSAPEVTTDWLKYYEENGEYVISVDADVMSEYGNYYAGSLACTVVEIANIYSDTINAKVDSDSESLTYSFTFKFSDSSEIDSYQKGDIVEIVGTIDQQTELFGLSIDTVNVSDCHIVASGVDAEARREELKSTTDTQIYYAQAYVQQLEADAEAAEIADKESYKASCNSVSYDDVSRNPGNYEGSNITVSGTVIQVSEGWFDSVTLRVSDNGNVWLVTYVRGENESRILEDDYVTVYGESTGVTSYTTVLGNTITIPSVKAQIIE